MKNYSLALVVLFLSFTTSAFAQKETKNAMIGTWTYASADLTKYNNRVADGSLSASAKDKAEQYQAMFLNSKITFNENGTFTFSSPTRVEKGNFSIGQGDSMKYEVNGSVTLFYVDSVSPTELVIRFEDSSILYHFSK